MTLAKLLVSKEAQVAFNLKKGSIPAREDAAINRYDDLSKATIAAFHAATLDRSRLVPATSVIAPPDYITQINELLADFAGTSGDATRADRAGNASVVLYGLANRSDALRNSVWHYGAH